MGREAARHRERRAVYTAIRTGTLQRRPPSAREAAAPPVAAAADPPFDAPPAATAAATAAASCSVSLVRGAAGVIAALM